jgi:hypothetical protein
MLTLREGYGRSFVRPKVFRLVGLEARRLTYC